MKVLGINAVFHDPAAALVVDGELVAASEEERLSRRKHGKRPVPFSTWELPEKAAQWCLEFADLEPDDLDVVTYSYDPALAPKSQDDITGDEWEGLRTLYARRADRFLSTALPGLDPQIVTHIPHHVCHAASAYLTSPFESSAVMTVDGRGETATHISGRARAGELEVFSSSQMPHSLGMVYEELTDHLGFLRSSDEYKVMALASYGEPTQLDSMRQLVEANADGSIHVEPIPWSSFAKRVRDGEAEDLGPEHADLAASVQTRLEEVLLEMATWLHSRTGEDVLSLAGGVALNCVANTTLWRESPFAEIWVHPAAGDAGTAVGGALFQARRMGELIKPVDSMSLGRGWDDEELESTFRRMRVPYRRSQDIARDVAGILARDGVVAWYQGRSEWGPRALGHRSLLADPRSRDNLERMNAIKGRERFRPIAPMVLAEAAAHIFDGPLPSKHMLFTHDVRPEWRDRIPTVTHVDGTSRIQTIDRQDEPLVHRMISAFAETTGVPVVVNTSLNTAGRPMVDDPRDLLECFASAPIDAIAAGSLIVERADMFVEAPS